MKKSPIKRSKKPVSFQQKQKQQLMLAFGFYAVFIVIAAMGKLSWSIVGWYALNRGGHLFSLCKRQAKPLSRGQWRTPESTLHLLSVLGGWVGAMMAQNYLRHKTKKSEFRLAYYLTVFSERSRYCCVFISGGDDSRAAL